MSRVLQRGKVQPGADAGGRPSGSRRGRARRRLHVAIGRGQRDQDRRYAESRHRLGLLRVLRCHRLHQLGQWAALQRPSQGTALLDAAKAVGTAGMHYPGTAGGFFVY